MMPKTVSRWTFRAILAVLLTPGAAQAAVGDDLALAPPAFAYQGSQAVFVDFQDMALRLIVDVPHRKITGEAMIHFFSAQSGHPVFDLVAEPLSVSLNGTITRAPLISDPDHVTSFRALDSEVEAGSTNTLIIRYEMSTRHARFSAQGVSLGFYTNDLGDRGFLEQYAPSGFEFDHWRMSLDLTLTGATHPHRFFANGRTSEATPSHWLVEFPEYFNASSFFVVLSDAEIKVLEGSYSGLERNIPVTIFTLRSSSESVGDLMTRTLENLRELETRIGPYPHERLIVDGDGGGMEYCGAVQADFHSLKHELNHQWFARGVMPANGNSGWIDEALVTWISGPPAYGASGRLSGGSPYLRQTPLSAYFYGSRFFAKLDGLLASRGGLMPILRDWFAAKRLQSITTSELESFIESSSGMDFRAVFLSDVYTDPNTSPGSYMRSFMQDLRNENGMFRRSDKVH